MFPKMRRFKQELSREECIEILKNEPRGIMSVLGTNGYPYGFPMNYVYNESTGRIYLHCAKEGYKLECLRADPKVSFCVHDRGFRRENEWALNIKSVIIFGEVREIAENDELIAHLRELGLKLYPNPDDVEEEIKKSAKNAVCLELEIHHMTGKIVNES